MTTFAAETRMPFRTLTAQLELGERILRGTVRNEGSEAIRDVAIVYGSRALVIGNLAPGESKNVEFAINNMGSNGTGLSMMIFKDRWNAQTGPPPELRIPVQIIDSLYSYSPALRSATPLVIGWLGKSPIQITANEQGMEKQQLTLVEAPVALSYGSAVAFPRGLLGPEYSTGGPNNMCMTQWGSGVIVDSDTITATLRLPEGARDLRVTKATLYPQVEGQPPQRILSEVFDNEANAWTQQSEKLASFDLSDPARFWSNGTMQVRINIPAAGLRGGCMTIDSSIEGTR
jgi:hypothetical protein